MTGYMIVGMYDCPWLAKACVIVDMLIEQDPTRKFTVVMKDSFEWQDFLDKVQRIRGWDVKDSPLVWEILVDPEGKGNLIGGIDAFCEYATLVFGPIPHVSTYEIELAVCKNKASFNQDGRDRYIGKDTKVMNIAIIQPPTKALELLLTQLLSCFPITDPNTVLNIRLYDTVAPVKELQGLFMEATDMASPTLYNISTSFNLRQFFYDAHLVLMMQDFSQGELENYTQWLSRVESVVGSYAESLNVWGANKCKILVGCNGPQCFIAEIFRKGMSPEKTPHGYIAAIGQQVVNRAKAELGRRGDLPSGSITRLHAWGWPGLTGAWVEVKDGLVRDLGLSIQGPTPILRPLSELAKESDWIFTKFKQEFLRKQKKLLAEKTRKMYSDMSLVEAIISTLHVWFESSRITEDKRVKCPSSCAEPERVSRNKATISLPVISVGILTSRNFGFPEGTFLVQPAMCYMERWLPVGKVSEGTCQRIQKELAKLWVERQAMLNVEELNNLPPSDHLEPPPPPVVGNQQRGYPEYAGELQWRPSLQLPSEEEQGFTTEAEEDIPTDSTDGNF